ncbi:hypothetical protein HanRHA438_Chr08g0363541 [Helianthus annuus]|nr:hypothetical protein HanHA89_Chr08g0308331 [Helianthus annuus]KAJ0899026.1 hypothetical protein HanRHA438_Chr08g0363541 [Helianthus annuus]
MSVVVADKILAASHKVERGKLIEKVFRRSNWRPQQVVGHTLVVVPLHFSQIFFEDL